MSASFPSAVKTFATRSSGQTIDAGIVNDLQDEVHAIEDGILSGTAPLIVGSIAASLQPRSIVVSNAAQTITTGIATEVLFGAEEVDVGAMHSTAVDTQKVTVPVGGTGFYLVSAQVWFTSNATGERFIVVFKNGSLVPGAGVRVKSNTVATTALSVTTMVQLSASDYISIVVYQDSTGDLTIGSFDVSRLAVVKLW